jgi:phosphatidylserine synthase
MKRQGRLSMTTRLKWLPNALTASRAVLAAAAFVSVLQNEWAQGFWLFLTALSTDFLDGLAAKKLHAQSKFGEELDGVIDSAIGLAGILSLSITGHLPWWILVLALAIGAAIGSDRIFPGQPRWWWRTPVAVAGLFVVWISVVWVYADLAFGWSRLYIVVTVIVLVICALLKRHRIRAWISS